MQKSYKIISVCVCVCVCVCVRARVRVMYVKCHSEESLITAACGVELDVDSLRDIWMALANCSSSLIWTLPAGLLTVLEADG